MAKSSSKSGRFEVKIDLQGLIRLLAKNLYKEADVFVRELIQNSHDSLKRRHELEQNRAPAGAIRICTDREAATISVTDNGSGLTETEIHEYLSTIGRSGTGEFRKELVKKGRSAEVSLIGQFGIGLLSAFVVAHRVEIETLSSQPNNPSWRWVSEGQKDYELAPGARDVPGTTVTLHISDNYRDMLDPDELRKAVKKYADFIPFPIHINDDEGTANVINAPWHRSYASENERRQDYWEFVNRRFPDWALEVIPIDIDAPYRVEGVLYISDWHVPDVNTTGMVDIYQTRMFITANNRDILPVWAKFVRGVIDSPDLTPTASRDAIQLDIVAREIRDALGRKVVEHLQDLATRDVVRFERVMDWHHYHIKGMAVNHDDFFDAIGDLVPFETNQGLMSLRRYLEKSPQPNGKPGHNLVYFSERGSATQFYMLCNAKGLLVINASYIFEEEFLKKYAKRHPGIHLHQINVAGSQILFEALKPDEAAAFRELEHGFRRMMPDPRSHATIARFKPVSLPSVTVLTTDAKLRQELEQTRRSLILPQSVRDLAGRILEERPTVPVTLYLNADNQTIQRMAELARTPAASDETYQAALLAIFNNAFLLAQHLITPENAQAIFTSSNRTIELMIEKTRQVGELQRRLNAIDLAQQAKMSDEHAAVLSDHITCMVALPFKDKDHFAYESVLLPALREVLELEPYYWQVVRADEKYYENNVGRNVATFMNRAHAYIAEISDLNPNVMMELGYLFWAEPARSRPLVVLEREGTGQHLSDLGDLIRIPYPNATGENAQSIIAGSMRREFGKKKDLQDLNTQKRSHYLSPLLLRNLLGEGFKAEIAQEASRRFPTMEAFSLAEVGHILAKVPKLSRAQAKVLKEEIADLLRNIGSST
ncbi:MAG: ATP-binding protein [Isosphaeraceae bacterium]